jgi:hypothetical protein
MCGLVRRPLGEKCTPRVPPGGWKCRHCERRLRKARGPRHDDAQRYASNVAWTIEQWVTRDVRAWPIARELTGPITDRLCALLLVWELTGNDEVVAEIRATERELLAEWQHAAALWAAQERRR